MTPNRRQVLTALGLTGAGITVFGVGRGIQPHLANLLSAKTRKFEFPVVTVNNKGEEIKRETKQAEYRAEYLDKNVLLEMISIPGGTFMMGTEYAEIERLVKKFNSEYFRREKPQHEVTVLAFWMGKYPITQKQWKVIAALSKIDMDLKPDPSILKGDDRPVTNVSWNESVEFCKRLSKLTGKDYRLPSEAEWEYACRSGTITPFHFWETITGDLANYDATETFANEPPGKYRGETTPVGQFPPNGFGLYDMHGNVWEWCADDWHENYQGAPIDGSAWISNNDSVTKILRGGSYDFYQRSCRSAYRYDFTDARFSYLNGLRVVCGLPRTGNQ